MIPREASCRCGGDVEGSKFDVVSIRMCHDGFVAIDVAE
jgi:hypothetical protein